MAVVARLWVAGELVNAAKMNTISTDLTELSGRVGTEIAAVSQTVTNAIAALGTASTHDVGTGDGNVPVLDSSGHLENARLSGIPRTALSIGEGSVTKAPNDDNLYFALHTYSLPPAGSWVNASGGGALSPKSQTSSTDLNTTDDYRARYLLTANGAAGAGTARWRYLAASNHPSVWAVVENGVVIAFFVSEDPVFDDDTESPIMPLRQFTAEGQPPGAIRGTIVNMGVPPDAVLSTLMATRAAALVTWQTYILNRNWAETTPATYNATITLVSDRYKPAARLWAMRAIADADGIGEAAAYLTLLRVGSGNTWELP